MSFGKKLVIKDLPKYMKHCWIAIYIVTFLDVWWVWCFSYESAIL